jgi:hypothetical protein
MRRIIHTPPERVHHRDSYLHVGLEPQRGRIQKETGRMTERNVSALPRPKENTPDNYTHLPLEYMDSQNHERQRIQ